VSALRKIYDYLNIRALSETKMQSYAELALHAFNLIDVEIDNKKVLMEFMEM
jgi:hypothetical protein